MFCARVFSKCFTAPNPPPKPTGLRTELPRLRTLHSINCVPKSTSGGKENAVVYCVRLLLLLFFFFFFFFFFSFFLCLWSCYCFCCCVMCVESCSAERGGCHIRVARSIIEVQTSFTLVGLCSKLSSHGSKKLAPVTASSIFLKCLVLPHQTRAKCPRGIFGVAK